MSDALIRSRSGISNEHLFHGVDLVVYSEGGAEYASVSAAIREGKDDTADAAFWSAVINVARPELAIHVKSVGCRAVAEQIALEAAKAGAANVCVCTDADVDHAFPNVGPKVPTIQSWGYSWEADIFDADVLKCVFIRLRSNSQRSQELARELSGWIDQFTGELDQYVSADVAQAKAGLPALFDRENPIRCFGASLPGAPTLDHDHLATRLIEDAMIDSRRERALAGPPIKRVCFGKLLGKAAYHAIRHFIRRARPGSIDFDTFIDLAIDCFKTLLPQRQDKFDYYRGALANVGI